MIIAQLHRHTELTRGRLPSAGVEMPPEAIAYCVFGKLNRIDQTEQVELEPAINGLKCVPYFFVQPLAVFLEIDPCDGRFADVGLGVHHGAGTLLTVLA